jgi:hypothetical protein
MQNLVVLLLAMTASGAIGFYLARERYRVSDDTKRSIGINASRMRRRARDAEEATKRLKAERNRLGRPRPAR